MPKYLPSLSLAKVTASVATLFISAFVLVSPVSAFELSPSNMVLASGASNTVSILATDSTTNGVSVHIVTEGLQVTGFEPAEGVLNIGICDNGSTFTETEVCVDLATPENFTIGQILGTFTIVKTGTGDAKVITGSDNKYANGKVVAPATFRVTETAPQNTNTTTDRTSQALSSALPLLVIAGILLILIVLLLIYILKGKKRKDKGHMEGSKSQSMNSTDSANSDKPMLPPLG